MKGRQRKEFTATSTTLTSLLTCLLNFLEDKSFYVKNTILLQHRTLTGELFKELLYNYQKSTRSVCLEEFHGEYYKCFISWKS